MSYGEFISGLLGGLIEVDNSKNVNIDNVIVASDKNTEIKEDGSVVIEDDDLTDEKLSELKKGFENDEVESFTPIDSAEEIEAIEKHINDSEIEEILTYFDGLLRENHHNALEASLYMRKLVEEEETNPESIKDDIEDQFGPEGRNISSLCSAEYFDKEGYLRELHQNMAEDNDFEKNDFKERFDEIVRYLPFTVFVSQWDSNKDVMIDLKRKLLKYQKYNVRFVDVRGIGEKNTKKINTVVNTLANETEDLEYESRKRDGELRIRIDPKSISEFEHVEDAEDKFKE
jgi:hypothetical protein